MSRNNTKSFSRVGAFCLAVTALGLTGTPDSSHAMDLYVGAALGQTKFDVERLKSGAVTGSQDDTDMGRKFIFGGPMFENFNLEFTIVDLGEFKVEDTAAGTTEINKARGWTFEGIGVFPIINKSLLLLARVGMFRNDFDTTCTVGGTTCTGNTSVLDLTYGLGVEYNLAKSIGVRVEWQQYQGLGDGTTANGDIDMLSASVLYKF